MTIRRKAAMLAVTGAFTLLYQDVLVKLAYDWANDDNYSHGFLIVPLALYFAWQRREALVGSPRRPSLLGLLIIVGSIAVMVVGVLGAELFLTRISMLGVVVGFILFLFGFPYVRILSFPLALLLLMIPLPAIIFNQIAFPLQLLASKFGADVLMGLNVPVFREGNIIVLPHTVLEVAEACSGIRSLISLLTLGIVYGHFADPRLGVRVTLAAATVPIAIVANGLRVAGTGFAAHVFSPAAAQGFFHTFSGWLVFVASFAMLVLAQLVVSRMASIIWRPALPAQVRWEM
jgi:exosortase